MNVNVSNCTTTQAGSADFTKDARFISKYVLDLTERIRIVKMSMNEEKLIAQAMSALGKRKKRMSKAAIKQRRSANKRSVKARKKKKLNNSLNETVPHVV